MSIQVAGLGADFTQDPNITLQNLLKDNWSATGASGDADLKKFDITTDPRGVKFLTSWWDGTTWYQVVTRPITKNTQTKTLGASRWEVNSFHQVHVFAKGNSAKDKRWKLEREVRKILQLNQGTTSSGVQMFILNNFRQVPEDDPSSDIQHSMAEVLLFYHEVKV